MSGFLRDVISAANWSGRKYRHVSSGSGTTTPTEVEEFSTAASNASIILSEEGGGGNVEAGFNLILVVNLNMKVVLCDCGRAYKVPEDFVDGDDISTSLDMTDNSSSSTAIVAIKDVSELKERF